MLILNLQNAEMGNTQNGEDRHAEREGKREGEREGERETTVYK